MTFTKTNYYRKGLELGWQAAHNRKQEHDYICKYCGGIFHRRGMKKERVKFCSLKCKYEGARGIPRPRTHYLKKMRVLSLTPPVIGEIRSALGAGLDKNTRQWIECPECHIKRWIRYRSKRTLTNMCKTCYNKFQKEKNGDKSPFWKGGRRINSKGYIEIWLSPNDLYYPMINKTGTVMEHRLVMAKHLGRCLKSWETVHHINHIKTDNRLENLKLDTINGHSQITILENRIYYLENRVTILEAENIRLNKNLEHYTQKDITCP